MVGKIGEDKESRQWGPQRIDGSSRHVTVVSEFISDACVAWWIVAIIQHFCGGRPACPMICLAPTRRKVHGFPGKCENRDPRTGQLFSANKGTQVVTDLESLSKGRASHIVGGSIRAPKDLLAGFDK